MTLGLVAFVLFVGYWYFIFAPAPAAPRVLATKHLDDDVSYLEFDPGRDKPTVLVLHGALGNGRQIRQMTAYGFETGEFRVVYPDSKTGWTSDEIPKLAKFNAQYVFGYGLGGQMAFRLAAATETRAIAIVAATLTNEDLVPTARVMLVYGTKDRFAKSAAQKKTADFFVSHLGQGNVETHAIEGGGHTIPQGKFRFPRVLGPTVKTFDAIAAAREFFTGK